MILTLDDFKRFPKVLYTLNQDSAYYLGLGDQFYNKKVRLYGVESDELPTEANVLDEVKELMILDVCIKVAEGLVGQNVQEVTQGIVTDPWQMQLDTFKKDFNQKDKLVGANHFIKDAEYFPAYTAKVN